MRIWCPGSKAPNLKISEIISLKKRDIIWSGGPNDPKIATEGFKKSPKMRNQCLCSKTPAFNTLEMFPLEAVVVVISLFFFCFFGTWSSGYRTSLTFFNSGDYVEFQAKILGNNAHKIAYMWLLAQTICGKLWKNVGGDLYWIIVKCGRQFAQH